VITGVRGTTIGGNERSSAESLFGAEIWTVESGWNDSVSRLWLCSWKPPSIGIVVARFMVQGGGHRASLAK
jgi:hypothetical protein